MSGTILQLNIDNQILPYSRGTSLGAGNLSPVLGFLVGADKQTLFFCGRACSALPGFFSPPSCHLSMPSPPLPLFAAFSHWRALSFHPSLSADASRFLCFLVACCHGVNPGRRCGWSSPPISTWPWKALSAPPPPPTPRPPSRRRRGRSWRLRRGT